VRPARHGPLGFFDLVTDLKNDHLHSYVLSLPVNTEIGQVRGHDGYGFPKWVTKLDVDITATTTTARVANDAGGTDLAFSAPTPAQPRFRSGHKNRTHEAEETTMTDIKPVLEPAAKELAEQTDPHPRIYEVAPEQGRQMLLDLQSGEGVDRPDVDEEWVEVDAGEWGTVRTRIIRPAGCGRLPGLRPRARGELPDAGRAELRRGPVGPPTRSRARLGHRSIAVTVESVVGWHGPRPPPAGHPCRQCRPQARGRRPADGVAVTSALTEPVPGH